MFNQCQQNALHEGAWCCGLLCIPDLEQQGTKHLLCHKLVLQYTDDEQNWSLNRYKMEFSSKWITQTFCTVVFRSQTLLPAPRFRAVKNTHTLIYTHTPLKKRKPNFGICWLIFPVLSWNLSFSNQLAFLKFLKVTFSQNIVMETQDHNQSRSRNTLHT